MRARGVADAGLLVITDEEGRPNQRTEHHDCYLLETKEAVATAIWISSIC